jgi:hypothetical protein
VVNDLNGEDLMLNSVAYCFKYSLNQLCFLHFNGDEYEIQFLMFILNNSPHLREIKIHCSRHFTTDKEKMTDVWNQLARADLRTTQSRIYIGVESKVNGRKSGASGRETDGGMKTSLQL